MLQPCLRGHIHGTMASALDDRIELMEPRRADFHESDHDQKNMGWGKVKRGRKDLRTIEQRMLPPWDRGGGA